MKTRAFWSVFAPVANALLRIRRKPRKSNWPSSEDRRALISDAATPIGVFFRRGGHGGGFGEYTPVCLGGSSCPTPCGSPMAGRFPGAGGRLPIRNGVGGIERLNQSIVCYLERPVARLGVEPGQVAQWTLRQLKIAPGIKPRPTKHATTRRVGARALFLHTPPLWACRCDWVSKQLSETSEQK